MRWAHLLKKPKKQNLFQSIVFALVGLEKIKNPTQYKFKIALMHFGSWLCVIVMNV